MYFDKLKKRFDSNRKKDFVYILSTDEGKFSNIIEALSIYGIEAEVNLLTPSTVLETISSNNSAKTSFIVDGSEYSDSDVEEIAMLLRGRFPSVLVGDENTIDAVWRATELGYTDYSFYQAENNRLVTLVLKSFGYIRSRASMIIGICNTTPDINLSYRFFDDLKKNKMMQSYSTLFINCDVANIYYDASLGIRANPQLVEHITKDSDELDSVSSRKLISTFDDHFDYASFNLMTDEAKAKDSELLIKGIDNFVDSVSDIYGFIFINIPYYLLTSENSIKMLSNSDIRVLLTNAQIESIYNVNFLKKRILFKAANKNKDRLICIRQPLTFSAFRITDGEIKSKLGISVDYSTNLMEGKKGIFGWRNKSDDNVIDHVFG